MDTTIRCDEVKVISEGEKVKLIITNANEEDIQDAYAEIDRQKYYGLCGYPDIHDGEY